MVVERCRIKKGVLYRVYYRDTKKMLYAHYMFCEDFDEALAMTKLWLAQEANEEHVVDSINSVESDILFAEFH